MDAPRIFGVRHLSPGTACHLLRFLDEHKPQAVLLECPSDATELMPELARKGVIPPVALLAYTQELPVETALYPFARYSPELQAAIWAVRHKKLFRCIDLPSDILLGLRHGRDTPTDTQENEDKPQEEHIESETDDAPDAMQEFHRFHNRLYEELARLAGESDYESYWERCFEHNLHPGSLEEALVEQSARMRELVENHEQSAVPHDFAYNLVREAHMRREIRNVLDQGIEPEKVVVIVGAYHVAGLNPELPPLSDAELAAIPRVRTSLTLMPYSYHRLSSRTGYGAGNKAPYYFDMLWQCLRQDAITQLPALYLSRVARTMREKGYNASPASVIEAVRLANSLSSLRSGSQPVLKDLHDAAVACLGWGELGVVAEALNMADIGTAIGRLPEGVSQTPVQHNLNQEIKRLKLERYKSTVAQELSLDLRENFRVKSEAAAFLDLNRSTFLHRLQALGIHFAEKLRVAQESATWAEKWMLRWTPEAEIEIVEANLKGETIEIAAAYQLREALEKCESLAPAAAIIRQACECGLTRVFDNALAVLQALLVEAASFKETAEAARELSLLLQYGDIRRIDSGPLRPVLRQLFLRASLLLVDAASCDDKAAGELLEAVSMVELVSQEQYELVDTALWQRELTHLARRDDRNSRLSGAAFAILLEHNLADEDDCAREVSRRLSPGVPADLGAGWFEGLASRNRYALLSRVPLWQELDAYIHSLDETEFMRAVVFLRRAFSVFEPAQKNSLAELLGELWGLGAEQAAELLQAELSEQEQDKLDELNDFDFEF